jgi:hypothetical protein
VEQAGGGLATCGKIFLGCGNFFEGIEMKEFIRREWVYLLMIAGLLAFTFMQVSSFRFGFFTKFDQAYFLLKLQEAYDRSCITGKSQWNLIAIHWFPYLDLTYKVNSCLASSILSWISVIAITVTSCILYGKKRVVKYFALSWLLLFGVGGLDLSYIPMQMVVLVFALCSLMLFKKREVVWKKCLYAMICGISLGLALFIYILSALVLVVCVASLIVIMHWKEWRRMLLYIGSGVAGVLLACLYIHLVVCPLGDIYEAMLFTSTYIGKSGYGYDSVSMIIRYGLFFRNCLFAIIAFVGAYWLSKRFERNWIGGIVYVALILVYCHYQEKPSVTSSMIMMSMPLLPFLFGKLPDFKWADFKRGDTWFYLFLFVFPFIGPLGTNTGIGTRMTCFMAAWLFIWFDNENRYPQVSYRRICAAVMILFAMPLSGVYNKYNKSDNSHHFTRGNKNFAKIALTEKQADYFNNVYDILEEYNFQPKKSAVLTAIFDYCSLYAFDAINAANYYQVHNFSYFPKDKMMEPDFIFLSKYDSMVMAKELKEMPWGWPEEYDKYYVDTPESSHSDLETRNLYCKKSLRKELK